MNEDQLHELENQDIALPAKECGFICQHEEEMKEGIEWGEWIIAGLAIGFISVVMGLYLWNKYSQNQKEIRTIRNQLEDLKREMTN